MAAYVIFDAIPALPDQMKGCRQAQPALSNEALRAVQARAAAWTTVAGGG